MTIQTPIRQVFISGAAVVLIAAFVAAIAGCSFYSSNGRKTFEDRSKGNLTSTNVGQTTSIESSQDALADTCWTQPSQDPLWETPKDQEVLRVEKINSDVLEVCIVE